MTKRSITSRENKARGAVSAWITDTLRAIGGRVFAADDRAAREHGWQVVPSRRGLARQYRDPRFSMLSSCPWCHGSGRAGQQGCPACRGTGRISRGQPPRQWGGEDDDQEPFAAAR